MDIRQALNQAIAAPEYAADRDFLGKFWIYDIRGDFLVAALANCSLFRLLAKTLEMNDAALFIPDDIMGQPPEHLEQAEAQKACQYIALAGKSWLIKREEEPAAYDDSFLEITPAVAETLLELAAS